MGKQLAPRRCKTIEERFWPKVDQDGPIPERCPHLGPCWIWTASVDRKGYGQMSKGRTGERMLRAHRVAYTLVIGPIPEGFELDHLCRVHRCVNPRHLDPVPHQVNCLRGTSPAATAARKTECPSGHPYDAENTYVRPNGNRVCRECARRRQGPYATRQRAYVQKPRRSA